MIPDDLKRLAVPCLAHRTMPTDTDDTAGTGEGTDGANPAKAAITEILDRVPVPV